MASVSYLYCLLVSLAVLIRAAPEPSYKRQSSSLTVDLGYEVYEGFANTTTNINNWLGYVALLNASLSTCLTASEFAMLNRQLVL